MAIKEMVVTPEMARDMLDRNINNRKLSQRRVGGLVSAMRRGEWQYNGDTIRISKSGRLLDGQHRLSAIEQSGIAQKYIIVDGLDDGVFTTIDTGSARDAGQMLAIAGEKNTTALASIAKMQLVYMATGRPIHGNPDKAPTHTQIVELAESDDGIKASANFTASKKWLKKYLSPSVAGFCHYALMSDNPQMAGDFFSEMESGEYSYRDSPIKYIRDFFIEERNATVKTGNDRRIAMVFHAYRAYRIGKQVKFVRLPKEQGDWYKL